MPIESNKRAVIGIREKKGAVEGISSLSSVASRRNRRTRSSNRYRAINSPYFNDGIIIEIPTSYESKRLRIEVARGDHEVKAIGLLKLTII